MLPIHFFARFLRFLTRSVAVVVWPQMFDICYFPRGYETDRLTPPACMLKVQYTKSCG